MKSLLTNKLVGMTLLILLAGYGAFSLGLNKSGWNPSSKEVIPPSEVEEVKGDLICPEGEITCLFGGKHCSTKEACEKKFNGSDYKKEEPEKVLGTTVKKQPINAQNPNDPVHCNIDPMCGGGTRPLTRAECANSICCETPDGFKFYMDKSLCANNQGGSTIPTNQEIILKQAEVTANSFEHQFCLDEAMRDYDACADACSSEYNENYSICDWAYDPLDDRRQECRDEVSGNWDACSDGCGNKHDEDMNDCAWW